MTNHLTPSELAAEAGIDPQDVISKCVQMGVPIFHGKIDKTLFKATLEQAGEPLSFGSDSSETRAT